MIIKREFNTPWEPRAEKPNRRLWGNPASGNSRKSPPLLDRRDQAGDVSLKHKVWDYWEKVEQACLERARATEQSQPQLETCWRLEGKRNDILASPPSYSLILCQCLPCPNQARNQLTWERRDCSQQVDTQQSKENDLWANRPRTKECLQLTQMFKTQIFIPRTSSSCLPACLRGCQQLPKPATWISPLIAFLSSFWQSITKSFDLCSLYLSKEFFFSIPTVHPSFRSPLFDMNDHTSLLTGILLLDLPLTFLPIHFTHTLNYSINLIMSTSCLKPFFCGAPVVCPQNEIQTPFLMRSFKSGPFCFQPHVFIRSLIHACLHSLSQ